MEERIPDSELLDRSFRDLSEADQWRWLRLSTVKRIRDLWKVRNTADGLHPYVCASVARSYIREEVAYLRELRRNARRER